MVALGRIARRATRAVRVGVFMKASFGKQFPVAGLAVASCLGRVGTGGRRGLRWSVSHLYYYTRRDLSNVRLFAARSWAGTVRQFFVV
jgi:hypothetical protein